MRVAVILGDITTVSSDAIVNAANSSLLGGGGVDGVIHRKGGPIILEDCRRIRQAKGNCKTGEAVITRGGKLPAKHVIHTVGPVYNEGGAAKEMLLANCYKNSVQVLKENGLRTIAFPNISTGIYRFPKQRAAEIAVATINDLSENMQPDEVLFVCFEEENYKIYKELLK